MSRILKNTISARFWVGKLVILALASAAASSCRGGGGSSSDLRFLDLEGPVRAVSWTGGCGLTSGQWDFDADGALVRGVWTVSSRDSRGRIKAASACEYDSESGEEFFNRLEFRLDRKGRLAGAVDKSEVSSFVYKFERDPEGALLEVVVRDVSDSEGYVYTYSNYLRDSLGNWTQRRFTVTRGGKLTNSGLESRNIVYFNE